MNNLLQEAQIPTTEAADHSTQWIWVARALSIYLIVWLHTDIAPDFVSIAVQGATATFFLISGYYLPDTAKKAAFTSLISARTWLIWATIATLIYALIQGGVSWQQAIGWEIQSYNYPLWFLRTLIIYQLIIAAIVAIGLIPRHRVLITIMLAGMAYFTEWSDLSRLNFSWFVTILIGYSLKSIPMNKIGGYFNNNWLLLLVVAILYLIECNIVTSQAEIMAWKFEPANLTIHSFAYSILILAMSTLIINKLPKSISRLIARIGSCSMFIFVTHAILNGIIHFTSRSYFGGTELMGYWTPLLTLIFSTIVCLCLQSKFPRLMEIVGLPRG